MSTEKEQAILPTLEKLKADGEIDPLSTLIYTALGAASACWENLSGAGVFESDRCKKIGDELMAALRSSPAEPVEEPQRWMDPDNGDIITPGVKDRANEYFACRFTVPLYAHPPLPKEASEQQPLDFGDYCWIEQYRYHSEGNEIYQYKIVGRLKSNSYVSVPVRSGSGYIGEEEVLHEEIEDVVVYIAEVLRLVNAKYEMLLAVMGEDVENAPDDATNKLARFVLDKCGMSEGEGVLNEPNNGIEEAIHYIRIGAGLRAIDIEADSDLAMDFAEQGARTAFDTCAGFCQKC